MKSIVVKYKIDLFEEKELTVRREKKKYTKYYTVKGSRKFMVMVFDPDKQSFLASLRICLCQSCRSSEFADCEEGLFKEHALSLHTLTKFQPRSETTQPQQYVTSPQIQEDSVVVVGCDDINFPFYLLKVVKKHEEQQVASNDGYGHEIPAGFSFIEGRYLERKSEGRGVTRYSVSKKHVYFYTESILYPCDIFSVVGAEIRINDSELVLINDFVNNSN